METQAQTFAHASAMPAPTWHYLKMNDTGIAIPEGLAIASHVTANVPENARGLGGEFDSALADAQAEWEASHPAPTPEELAEKMAFLAAEADATYGGTAQSGYQAKADAIEEARSLSAAFEQGMGDETAAYLRDVANGHVVIVGASGKTVDAQVVVTAMPDALCVAAIDVVADSESTVNLSIVVKDLDESENVSPTHFPESESEIRSPTHPAPFGIAGTTLRVFAGANAQVSIVRTQALGDGYEDLDDMGLFAAADARIDVRQTVLGGARSFTGLAGDLRGESSTVNVDTRYLGYGEQERDFNYSLRHHGPKTQSNMLATGVLAGTSKKTLRGTIDLIRGCKGAEGSERETVLLVDEGVRNKTVPVILCNEDDVAGNHGATIGHIRDEQLFYLASRGLSQEAAEHMFVNAVLEQAAIDAPDDAARAAVLNLGEHLAPGFAELFEE